jgi:hypothetical protein
VLRRRRRVTSPTGFLYLGRHPLGDWGYGKLAIVVSTEPMLPSVEPVSRSPAAERMRRHRQRRRNRLRCFTVELRETEIDTLIRKGLLRWETRNDRSAIIKALYDFFDHTLNPTP